MHRFERSLIICLAALGLGHTARLPAEEAATAPPVPATTIPDSIADSDMVDIWLRTKVGLPIEIRP